MDKTANRARTTLARSIWFSIAFAILCVLLLVFTVADQTGLLTIPVAFKPYCGPEACDYGELIKVLLSMTFIGAVMSLGGCLARYFFIRD